MIRSAPSARRWVSARDAKPLVIAAVTTAIRDRAPEHQDAAGGGILHCEGQISLAAAVVAPGLMVLAIILFTGRGLRCAPEPGRVVGVRGPW